VNKKIDLDVGNTSKPIPLGSSEPSSDGHG
jgi:hypothetical protein